MSYVVDVLVACGLAFMILLLLASSRSLFG